MFLNKKYRKQLEYAQKIEKALGTREILDRIGEIDNCHNCFYTNTDYCPAIPKYKFKFKANTSSKVYCRIKNIIESFNGNLEWTLWYEENQPSNRYYLIVPKKYAVKEVYEGSRAELNEEFKSFYPTHISFEDEIYGYHQYKNDCQLAIADIPLLISYFSSKVD